MNKNRKKILGYDIDLISFQDAIEYLKTRIDSKLGTHIITINPEIIEQADKNQDLNKIIKESELVIPDGVGIQIALKINGIKQERIPGVDLALELIKLSEKENYSIALIGAKEHVIKKTEQNLENEYPKLNIVYARNGYFNKDEENEIINNISQKNPQIVFAALGAPKQELFINECRKKLPNSTFIGIGGSFDVWAGEVERAPELFRKTGFEWLYRTIKQPERFKRIYKTLPVFLFKVIIECVNN